MKNENYDRKYVQSNQKTDIRIETGTLRKKNTKKENILGEKKESLKEKESNKDNKLSLIHI